MLKDDGRQSHEDQAAEQDEEQRGENADLRLTDFPLLRGDKRMVRTKTHSHVRKTDALIGLVGLRGKRRKSNM